METQNESYLNLFTGVVAGAGYLFGIITLILMPIIYIRDPIGKGELPGFVGAFIFMLSISFLLVFFMRKNEVRFENGNIVIKLGSKKIIPFSSITALERRLYIQTYVYRGSSRESDFLSIFYGNNKKVDIRLNAYEKGEEIAEKLAKYTGLSIKKSGANTEGRAE